MNDRKEFWRVTLDTNPDFCNIKCIMCEDHSPYADDKKTRKSQGRLRPIMDKSLVVKVIREVAELGFTEIIPSTMGEPLLYPYFDSILELCHELGMKLNLTTNGTFPGPEKNKNVEYWARRIIPIGSDVKISWNGATEMIQEDIMRGTTLTQQVQNARRFIAIRDELADQNYCSITMQLTYMHCNLEEIPDIVKLAIELGFDRVKGHQLWNHFDEMEGQSLRNNILSAERWNEIVDECEAIVALHNSQSEKTIKLDNFSRLDSSNLKDIAAGGACPFLGREIWIDPTGRINVCCAPDQQRKALGDFGNVVQSPVKDIINGRQYSELLKNYQEHSLCKSCNMRRLN